MSSLFFHRSLMDMDALVVKKASCSLASQLVNQVSNVALVSFYDLCRSCSLFTRSRMTSRLLETSGIHELYRRGQFVARHAGVKHQDEDMGYENCTQIILALLSFLQSCSGALCVSLHLTTTTSLACHFFRLICLPKYSSSHEK